MIKPITIVVDVSVSDGDSTYSSDKVYNNKQSRVAESVTHEGIVATINKMFAEVIEDIAVAQRDSLNLVLREKQLEIKKRIKTLTQEESK